jgi:diacylglycerol kinase (ATP)
MNSKRALIIVNTLARQGQADIDEACEIFRRHGIQPTFLAFENVSQLKNAIQRFGARVDLIVIGGGDGTLNAAVETVLRAGLPLGVLPMGTANDLARTLQIPSDIAQAANIIVAGRIKKIDLGWVNHKHFFNVASIGLAVKVTHNLSRPMKARWGTLAYPLSLIKAYYSMRPYRSWVNCDGNTRRFKSIQISVGNGRHYGGGMAIRHDAAIDDHRLYLYSLRPKPMWRLLRAAPSIMKGTMEEDDLVCLMEGQEIQITTSRPLPIETDGEITTRTPALFRVSKQVLPVFVA